MSGFVGGALLGAALAPAGAALTGCRRRNGRWWCWRVSRRR
jgi:hypothetical protein